MVGRRTGGRRLPGTAGRIEYESIDQGGRPTLNPLLNTFGMTGFSSRSGWKQRHQLLTRIGTPAATFCARLAVVMHVGVRRAFFSADAACRAARDELCPQQLPVRRRLARQHRCRCRTNIGAIEIEANATAHGLRLGLGQAGIGADVAAHRALQARAHATFQCFHVLERLGMLR